MSILVILILSNLIS